MIIWKELLSYNVETCKNLYMLSDISVFSWLLILGVSEMYEATE